MMYLIAAALIATIFFLTQNENRRSAAFLILMCASLLLVSLSFVFYIAKDNSYYLFIKYYFNADTALWNSLMFFPVERTVILRALTLASLAFVYGSLCFALEFSAIPSKGGGTRRALLLAVPPVLQAALYDPGLYPLIYLVVYPRLVSATAFARVQDAIHGATMCLNALYLLAGIAVLAVSFARSLRIRSMRSYTFVVLVNHLFITLSYGLVFWWSPAFLVRTSKVASYASYATLPLTAHPTIYKWLPLLAAVTFVFVAFGAYRLSRVRRQVETMELEISRHIDAATVTSTVFCHYMKNELLAIMAELELMEGGTGAPGGAPSRVAPQLRSVEQRCRNIYGRLDAIQGMTRSATLSLKPAAVDAVMDECIRRNAARHPDVRFRRAAAKVRPRVMLDERYFQEAVQNIMDNAYDAMRETGRPPVVRVSIETHASWVVISITDNGKGIPRESMDKVLRPFYSTKPTSTNWGVGLSVCHRIMAAHDGRMELESEPDVGTTVRVLLPRLHA